MEWTVFEVEDFQYAIKARRGGVGPYQNRRFIYLLPFLVVS
jgi:hypothetical protein